MTRRAAWALLAASAWLTAAGPAGAQVMTIDFDTAPGGGTVVAPINFSETTRLTTLYAPLGVTFSGPGGNDGGAILNQDSNFGVNARSGVNFLAFNRDPNARLSDGGRPIDPETIAFATPQGQVSIFASGGFSANSFRIDAFDAGGSLIGSGTGTSGVGAYVQLSVAAAGIRSVVLTGTGAAPFFVYDDLSFTSVPEPSSLALTGVALAGAACRRWRRRS
jgi:hypothetical protein